MADRSILEYSGKKILQSELTKHSAGAIAVDTRLLPIKSSDNLDKLEKENPWLKTTKLVAKPDQLIKRRGANKLLLLNADWAEAKAWLKAHFNKEITIDGITDSLTSFLVEPFVPHKPEFEYYLAIRSVREGDQILFFRQGGVEVGHVEEKAVKLTIPTLSSIDDFDLIKLLLQEIGEERRERIQAFLKATFKAYRNAGFTFLEINPFCLSADGVIVPLDMAARLDDTAIIECEAIWGDLEFPPAFGQRAKPEEAKIREMDANTGASLKFSLLNPKGRVWTLVAGGGASVVYTDTIADLGHGGELANYGEYSGNPTDEETYEYTKTVLSLMTKEADAKGRNKVLLIGGGIANFTDVAKTFRGIIQAIRECQDDLKRVKTKIYVRRGGPNYKEGLKAMEALGKETDLPIEVYGPETHMTRIVRLALS